MKIVMPIILASILVMGLVFGLIPVEKAATVHTTIQASTVIPVFDEELTDVDAASDNDVVTITVKSEVGGTDTPFILTSLIVCGITSNDGGGAGDIFPNAITIDGDVILEEDATALQVGASVADGQTKSNCSDIIKLLSTGQANPASAFGTSAIGSDGGDIVFTLELAEGSAGGAAADTIDSIKAVALTRSDATVTITTALP